MERTLANFIRALRMADVRVSTSETLDAFRTTELTGWRDRTALKQALALTLPKSADEKEAFDACFEAFFRFDDFQTDRGRADEPASEAETEPEPGGDADQGSGEGGSEGAPSGGDGGGRSSGDVDAELEELLHPGELAEPTSELGRLLMSDDANRLSLEIARGARETRLEEIKVFTQKGLFTRRIMEAMGLSGLQQEIGELETQNTLPERRLGSELKRRRDGLREQIRDYVERQFLIHADARGDRLREEMLRKVKLSNVEHRNFRHLRMLVQKMAKQLAAAHSRRRRVTKRGQLNVPKMLRRNMRHGGELIELAWKSTKIDRPKVYAICDVSGSMTTYARFMLMLLYSLEEVLPNVRAFAFSSDLGEVTDLFRRNDIDDAIALTLKDYGGGSTDYGQAFADFERLAGRDLDHRATLIVLGDARNNFGEPRTDLLRGFRDRSKRVIWLTPESELSWNSGDSEMRRYQAHVHQVAVCNSLVHLERVVSGLLRTVN